MWGSVPSLSPRHPQGSSERHRGQPLTSALVRRLVVPLVAVFIGFVAPLATLLVRDARHEVVEGVEDRAQVIALLASRTDLEDSTGAGLILSAEAGSPGEVAGVLDPAGRQVAGPALPAGTTDAPAVARARSGTAAGEIDPDLGLAIGAVPIQGSAGVAVVTVPAGVISTRYVDILGVLGLVSAVLLGAAILVGRSFARTIVDPIRGLDEMAQRLSEGDLEARAPVGRGPRELRRLADTLNGSAAEIQRLLQLEQTFAADASHQLRTPLAALRLRLENLELAGADPGGAAGAALVEVDRLTAIVSTLLDQARSSHQASAPVVTDVVETVSSRATAWRAVARPAEVTVRCTLPTAAAAWSVPAGLGQVLDNLLSNALRASPMGSEIDIEVTATARTVTVRVLDRGPGMGPEERAQAFRRFWRGEASASDGGTGLGLPIAAELVRASGGTIELLERPGGGLVVEVRLPAAGSGSAPPPERG